MSAKQRPKVTREGPYPFRFTRQGVAYDIAHCLDVQEEQTSDESTVSQIIGIHRWSLTWNLKMPPEKGDPYWKQSCSGSMLNFACNQSKGF